MFHFCANLKPYNVFRGVGNRRYDSYLLSVDFLDEHRDLAELIVREARTFCADNGNVDLIGEFIDAHETSADNLQILRKAEENVLGGKARPGQLSAPLNNSFQEFARNLSNQARNTISDEHVVAVLKLQESLDPTYIVGMEDFTLVALTGLNIEREYSDLPLSFYAGSTERAIDYALRTKEGAFGPCKSLVFGGLHAIDYDTAIQAGHMAGETNLDGIASGLVGAMKDRSFVDYRVKDNELIELGINVPRPYMRTSEIICGFHVGFAQATGRRLAFHGLGLGTPILLPIVALVGNMETFMAVDSTAPIKDAIARSIRLYVDTPAPRKLKAYRIAEFWLADDNGWRCTCPYCRKFTEKHPSNRARALEWWESEGKRALDPVDMLAPSPLAEFVPILSSPANDEISRFASMTRILHNHWALKRIETRVRKHMGSPDSLRQFVADTMEVYLSMPGSNANWQASARIAWEIADGASRELAGVPAK